MRSGLPDIIRPDELIEMIRDKSKRQNNTRGGKGKGKEVAPTGELSEDENEIEVVDE